MIPIPTHLRNIASPKSDIIDEEPLLADIKCTCENDSFEINFPGQTHDFNGENIPCTARIGEHFFFLVTAKCSKCDSEHCIINQDFHGWNGYICHDSAQAELARPPLVKWNCKSCDHDLHRASIEIRSQGKEDFIEEAGDEFDPGKWPDAFEWIDISIACCSCNKVSEEWVSLETM